MKISIIVGAHKTGTTYLQAQFEHNFKLLLKHKVFYLSLSETRNNITQILDKSFLDLGYIKKLMTELKSKKIEHLILFDENFIGTVKNKIGRSLYPNVEKRLEKLFYIFNSHGNIKIFLITRNFPDYIVSRYCEYLRHYKYIDFEDYFNFNTKIKLTWEMKYIDFYLTYENLFLNVNSFFDFILNKNLELSLKRISFIDQRKKFSVEQLNILETLYNIGYQKGIYKKVVKAFNKKPSLKNITEFKINNKELFSKLSEDYESFLKNNKKLVLIN